MKKIIRIISFLIVLCVLLMTCTGFSVRNSDDFTSQDVELADETLILTVDSSPVYWTEFHFWLNYIAKYYQNYYHYDEITDWSTEQNGMSLSEFFLSCAVGYAVKDRAIEAKAEELGFELSKEDLAEIEETRKRNIGIYGSESEYIRIVEKMYLSEELFNYLTKIEYLSNYMFEDFYGANGEKCSDEDVLAYVEEEGYMCAKYIFLSNTDSDGNELSAEELAENHALLEEILGQLDAGDDPLTLFDALMYEYSEYSMVSKYPDGRLFVSGAMGKKFEITFLELKENEYSGIVKTDDGYYIILRMPIYPDMTADSSGNTLRYWTAYDYMFKNQINDWCAEMEIEHEDAYYEIDVEELFGTF